MYRVVIKSGGVTVGEAFIPAEDVALSVARSYANDPVKYQFLQSVSVFDPSGERIYRHSFLDVVVVSPDDCRGERIGAIFRK